MTLAEDIAEKHHICVGKLANPLAMNETSAAVNTSEPLADKSDFDAIFCIARVRIPIRPATHISFRLPPNAIPQMRVQVMNERKKRKPCL